MSNTINEEDRKRIREWAEQHSYLGKNFRGESLHSDKEYQSYKTGAEDATNYEREHARKEIAELRERNKALQKRWDDENNERIKLMGRYEALKAENERLTDTLKLADRNNELLRGHRDELEETLKRYKEALSRACIALRVKNENNLADSIYKSALSGTKETE